MDSSEEEMPVDTTAVKKQIESQRKRLRSKYSLFESSGSEYEPTTKDIDNSDSNLDSDDEITRNVKAKSQTSSSEEDLPLACFAKKKRLLDPKDKHLPSSPEANIHMEVGQPSTSSSHIIEAARSSEVDQCLLSYQHSEGLLETPEEASAVQNKEPNIQPTGSEEIDRGVRKLGRRKRNNKKDAQRKQLCDTGEQYVSKRGTVVRQRNVKAACGMNCKKKCSTKFSEAQRKDILDAFWKLGDHVKQWEYLARFVTKVAVKFHRSNTTSSKSTSRRYCLFDGNEEQQVCKTFFLNTLDISETRVLVALDKKDNYGFCVEDRRGKHSNRPWALDSERKIIEEHIGSFPKVESHYCRKKSKRQYLDPSLSIEQMHRLYTKKRTEEGAERIARLTTYKDVFSTKFNLGFHKPKNDQCEECSRFLKTKNPEDKPAFDKHREETDLVRKYRDLVKTEAREQVTKTAATFDLQEVLQTPKANEGILYYKRKLNNYNLSVFDFKFSVGFNFLWNECQARRGSNDIASCVYSYLMDMAKKGVTNVTLFSDSCGGQNRNRFFLAMIWYALNNSPLQEIEHVFFVRGHSENESDSVHAMIERASKPLCVYTTPQWATAIQGAKRSQPYYKVKEMTQNDFYNFKAVEKKLANTAIDGDRQKIKWMKIRKYNIAMDHPNVFHIYYEMNGTAHQLNLTQKLRKRCNDLSAEFPLEHTYTRPLPLSSEKHKDLTELCLNNIIPEAHHDFYKSLPYGHVSDEDNDTDLDHDE